MKIAVIVYGINRCISHTHKSINNMILGPLQDDYDLFLHTYKVEAFSNARSNEKNEKIDHQSLVDALKPTAHVVESQSDFDTNFDVREYTRCGDPYNDSGASVKNYVRALHSLHAAWDLCTKHGTYKAYVVIRPDVRFLDPIDVAELQACTTDDMFTPDWSVCNGFNDRLAFGGHDAMRRYCTRGDQYLEYMQTIHINSEFFLKHVMQNTKLTKTRCVRVQCKGGVDFKDRKILNKK